MKTKKRFLGILLSLALVLGLMPGTSLTAKAAETTVDYQTFFVNGITGATNYDVVSGTGGVDVTNDTTNTRGVTWDAQEKCAVFDGEAYLVINNPLRNANASTGFTITMEAYISSDNNKNGTYTDNRGNSANKNGWQRLFDLSDGTIQKYLYINAGSAGHLRYAVATNSNANQQGVDPSGSYYDAWHTYTLAVKPGGDMTLYVDGTQISSMTSNSVVIDALDSLSNFDTCYIGSSVYETTKAASDGFFIGKIRGFSTVNTSDVFKLSYNSNGGAENLESMTTPIIPDNLPTPTKENYTFAGWYIDSELTQKAISGTKLTADTTLFAKWSMPISHTVTFKVVNGSWDDKTTSDKTVTLSGLEDDTLKLEVNQIPAVGSKPNDNYKAGSWDTTPSANTAITEATTYTYTYAAKDAAVVTKAPEAKMPSYNGQAQELVTEGTADGGIMHYAVTTENVAPTDDNLYTTSIPTATDARTYYVWYKVVGDENHTDTEPVMLKVTIDVDQGETKIETEVKTDEKAPKLEASNLTKEVAESTLTDEEKEDIDEAVNDGKDVDVDVYLAIRDIADEITAEDKAKLEAEASDAGQLAYFDISLYKEIKVDGSSLGATAISELQKPLKLTIGVPKSFPAVETGYTRTYKVLRLHKGEVTTLPTTVNTDGTISFETDRFSIYALVYKDTKEATTVATTEAASTSDATTATATEAAKTAPKTGDSMPIAVLVVLMFAAAGMLVFMDLKKRKN